MDKASMRGGANVVSAKPDAEGVEVRTVAEEPAPKPEPIEVAADGTITVQISHPFRAVSRGADIATGLTKIVLREMTAGDMVEMDKGEGGHAQMMHLAASLSGLPTSVLERMHYADFAIVHAVVNDKLGKFLQASANALLSLPGR